MTIILQSAGQTTTSIIIQGLLAISSFGLLVYGTVVLASISMYSASHAVRVMVTVTVSAGFGRVAGFWVTKSDRAGRKTFLVDVPITQLKTLKEETTSLLTGRVSS